MKARPARLALAAAVWAAAFSAGSVSVVHASTITVSRLNDSGDATSCTLRQAINAANSNAPVGTCAAGSPYPAVDTIRFSSATCPKGCTVVLQSDLPAITEDVTISNSAGIVPVTINAGNAFRIFDIKGVSVTVSNLSLINAGTNGVGGAIAIINGSLIVGDVVFSANHAAIRGGAISVIASNVVVTNCTFDGNSAGESGGAIYQDRGVLIISGSTISNNSSYDGGGLITWNASDTRLTNVTFSGNRSVTNGGAISRIETSSIVNYTVSMNNVTITNNTADSDADGLGDGGGIFNRYGATFTVANSIIAGNFDTPNNAGPGTINPDCSSPSSSFTSFGYNTIGREEGAPGFTNGSNGDKVGVDPKLGPLAFNGGPTATHLLLYGSPAIDGGNPAIPGGGGFGACASTDQRGIGRPIDGEGNNSAVRDSGAVEVPLTAPPPTPTPTPTPTATPTATPTPPTTLANVSTRMRVETGDNVLIGGFIITGTQDKKVIIRAIGPSLPFAGRLENPTLELYSGSTLIASNDDWQNQPDAGRQAVIDSTIPPSNDLEAALVRTLPANSASYTAIVRGVNNGTGIGVVEAYDLDQTADSRLANISTRGFVQTGDNVLIAGTIILGQSPQKVIIRAIGPSLSVPGKMENPTLELRDQNGGLIEANDNWVDSPNKQAIIDSTIPPSDDLESAIVETLPANGASYTAIVHGMNDTTGIAVVEVYALP